MSEGIMDGLREQVREKLGACESCGALKLPEGVSLRDVAVEVGVAHSTLWRFLLHGKNLSADNIDKVREWLGRS